MTDSTARAQDAAGDEAHGARQGSSAIRLAVVDGDSGFLQVLTKRLDGVGWQYRVLASPVPLDTVVAMRLNAIVIDLAALGPQAWGYLERLCSMLPLRVLILELRYVLFLLKAYVCTFCLRLIHSQIRLLSIFGRHEGGLLWILLR